MRRVRILFILCALALLAPLAFLVHRAWRSVTLERQMRHQAVAERIFDEMERSLSGVLEDEEARPVEGYGDRAAGWPFVLGAFQVDPSGAVAVWPSATAGDAATLDRLVRASWRNEPAPPPAAAAQSPGTTVALLGGAAVAGAAGKEQAPPSDAYAALRSLNKAVSERVERQRQVERPPPAASDAAPVREERAGAGADVADTTLRGPAMRLREQAAALADERDSARVDGELPSLGGRLVDASHLMLYRTVVRGREAYRQGVLVDLPRLGDWLRAHGLGSDGLAEFAQMTFTPPAAGPAPRLDDGAFAYQHRFAEPFDGLSARLVLQPLPGVGSVGYVLGLSGLALASVVIGLAALYRMVAVTVGFAERRSNFVAAVTHELKTPLTAIRMYGEMLRDGLVPSEAKRAEYYRHITVESERLSRLINNVLEFARLEKGTRAVTLVQSEVAPVVREVAELLRPHVEREGFELALAIAPDLPPVRFEPDALVQVLCNLVDNAAKYARGSVPQRIVLSCRADGAGVCIGVRDHGPGVAARDLDRIFEPFYRGEPELTRRHKGTGLGLALVRGLAERMGAQVRGSNAEGGGFLVEIRLAA